MELVWVVKAEYITDYKISFTFNNGTHGIIDFEKKFDLPIYEPLKNMEYFKSFKLKSWTIAWENGADYAPEFLYELLLNQADAQVKDRKVIA